ncbi:Protein GTLF3B [Zootermopsis nevadensis]|uniref:Protein NATD1 n=1 Tax=Zootermopsis nevadensis TaxID=136037 RepID=A0A067QV01_ZOONE|nr:Protein GTLF3B [Zootermopsis nevadensis]
MLLRSRGLMKTVQNMNKTNLGLLHTKTLAVEHDYVNHRFYIKLGNDVAFIQYDMFNNVLDYKETYVPPAFRRKGVAQVLAEAAFDHAVKNDLKVKVTCTYLQKYLENHPLSEYTSRIVD